MEVIHHIDGDCDNNDPANLRIVETRENAPARAGDIKNDAYVKCSCGLPYHEPQTCTEARAVNFRYQTLADDVARGIYRDGADFFIKDLLDLMRKGLPAL